MKSTFVVDLSAGDTVDELFALRKVEFKEYAGGRFISIEIGDQSGRMKGVIWDGSPELMKTLIPGEIYRLKGMITSYKGESQVRVEKILAEKNYDPRDFLPVGAISLDDLDKKLTEAIARISDPDFKGLLEIIFSPEKYRPGFLQGVGGKLWHHNYIGGLAEHTLSIFDLCSDFADRYPDLKRDLMLTGALLHDIGKIQTYATETFIQYTDPGRLLGHIVIGDDIVRQAISCISDFPAEKALTLRHLILSHQGTLEQASPVPPMMAEGMALYIADLLDSKLAAMRRIKGKEHRPGIRWSNYVNLLERHLYFGDGGDLDDKKNI